MYYRLLYSVVIGCAVGFGCTVRSMDMVSQIEDTDDDMITLATTDKQDIVLIDSLIPHSSKALVKQNKAMLNGALSSTAWRLAFDVFSIAKSVESNNALSFDIITDQKNLFIKHNLAHDDAKKVIELLGSFVQNDSPVVNELLHAFIRFAKGDMRSGEYCYLDNGGSYFIETESETAFLNKLDNKTKTTLDTYCYLNFNRHLNIFKIKSSEQASLFDKALICVFVSYALIAAVKIIRS